MNQLHHLLLKLLSKFLAVRWPRILKLLGGAFVLAVGTSLLISKLFPLQPSKPRPPLPSPFVDDYGPTLSQISMQTIIKRNIFNIDSEVADDDDKKKDRKEISEIPESTLPLKLLGTIYGGDVLSGLAVIENTQKKATGSFLVGDEIMKHVTLSEVQQEKIIIDREGQKEFLALERPKLPQSKRRKNVGSNRKTGGVATHAPNQFKEEGFERNGNEITLSNEYKQKLLTTDFSKVLQDAKAEPNLEGGELNGFKLTRIRDDSIYQKAGIQDGDIIKEINGVSLTDTAQAIRLLNALRSEPEIEIRITRNGAPQVFNMKVR